MTTYPHEENVAADFAGAAAVVLLLAAWLAHALSVNTLLLNKTHTSS